MPLVGKSVAIQLKKITGTSDKSSIFKKIMQAGIINSVFRSFRTKCVKSTFCDISIRVTYEIADIIGVVLKPAVA